MEKEYRGIIKDRTNEILFQLQTHLFEIISLHGSMIVVDLASDKEESGNELREAILYKALQMELALKDYSKGIKMLIGDENE
jgi:hypothetical protein